MTKTSSANPPRAPANGPAGTTMRYRDRIFDAKRHDPYQAAGKYAEPAHCETCGAVFHRGRWQWGSPLPGGHSVTCPACRRIADKLPAGSLTLEGPFVDAHRDELVHLARNEAERERADHPLNRIMDVDANAARIVVTTTDIHLPQRIGEALKSAYDGELDVRYGEDEYTVRIVWRR
jgi:hypothetical protein